MRSYRGGHDSEAVRLGSIFGLVVALLSVTLASIWTHDPEWLRVLVCLGGTVLLLGLMGYLSHTEFEGVVLFDGTKFCTTAVAVVLVVYEIAWFITNIVNPGLLPGLTLEGLRN